MSILYLLRLLYGLSWVILVAPLILMFVVPLPPDETIIVIGGAFGYIATYFVLRGIGRVCGYGHPAIPVPPGAGVMRRVILEEVIPNEAGQPEHRVVLEEVAPYYERNGHAR